VSFIICVLLDTNKIDDWQRRLPE